MSLGFYRQAIIDATGCDPEDAREVEDIMRHEIFHSTLDWQTKRQFNRGAKQAHEVLKLMREQEKEEKS